MSKKKTLAALPDIEEFGPGLVTGAADDDPSGIATYTITGAQFGLQFLWTAWATWPLMAFVQMICAKVVIVSRKSLTDLMLKKFPRPVVLTLILGLFVANLLNVAADLAGMGDALALLTGGNAKVYTVLLALLITALMIRLNYKQISRTLTWLTFFLFSYVFTAFHAQISWMEAWHAATHPSWPQGHEAWATVVALLGTTISPYLFFWQGAQELEEVQDKLDKHQPVQKKRLIRNRRFDVAAGTLVSNVIMFFVILTAASSLHSAGITNIETSAQAAEALRPLLGGAAAFVYTLGLLGVGLLAVPTLSGSAAFALAHYFRLESGLSKRFSQARAFYFLITASTLGALLINVIDINPIRALFWSAVVNGLLSPILIVVLYLIATDAGLMGTYRISRLSRMMVALCALVMTVAAVGLLVL
jgi:Mn2+/Fe2+ NRAMP family transporter